MRPTGHVPIGSNPDSSVTGMPNSSPAAPDTSPLVSVHMETDEVFESTPHCRLSLILARSAPTAVVLRRGPSRWVQLWTWNTARDEFQPGQWFHGRIYDRRCDLSPDGSLLLYFASKFTGKTLADPDYTYAWTAISKPPYFTALALWPKGDCWHGGGLFETIRRVWLNHALSAARPHPDRMPITS